MSSKTPKEIFRPQVAANPRRRFALINLTIFACVLRLYLLFADRAPLSLEIALIIAVGASGWFGVVFLVLSFFRST
jgi:pilus assembly protein TadC